MRTRYKRRASYRHKTFLRAIYFYLFMISFCLSILLFRPVTENTAAGEESGAVVPLKTDKLAKPLVGIGSAPPSIPEAQWARITTAVALREEPKLTSPEMLKAVTDDWFPVTGQENEWYKVRLDDNQIGWIPKQAAALEVRSEHTQVLHVRADTPLYSGPDTSFGPAGTAGENTVYYPKQISGHWIELQTEGQGVSWIEAEDIGWSYGEPEAIEVFSDAEGDNGESDAEESGPLSGRTIVVDPGHGGIDSGARGKISDVYERDVNLSVARVLKHKLQAAGAHVIMTRTSNDQTVSLPSRVEISNQNKADLFVSIHQNMFAQDPDVSGTITFYSGQESEAPAKAIEQAALSALGSREEKVHIEQDQLYVLRNNERPAVLIEGCFLSNPKELENSLTTNYQEKLASGIYNGILAYMTNLSSSQSS